MHRPSEHSATHSPPPPALLTRLYDSRRGSPSQATSQGVPTFVSQKTGRRKSPGSAHRQRALIFPAFPLACPWPSRLCLFVDQSQSKHHTHTHKPQVDRSFPTTTEDQQRRQNPFSLGRFRRKREGQGAAGVGRSPNSRRLDDGLI